MLLVLNVINIIIITYFLIKINICSELMLYLRFYSAVKCHGAFGDNGVVRQNFHPLLRRFFQSLGKLGMGFAVGRKAVWVAHLDYKKNTSPVAVGKSRSKLINMLHTSLGGSVGKKSDVILLQVTPFTSISILSPEASM